VTFFCPQAGTITWIVNIIVDENGNVLGPVFYTSKPLYADGVFADAKSIELNVIDSVRYYIILF